MKKGEPKTHYFWATSYGVVAVARWGGAGMQEMALSPCVWHHANYTPVLRHEIVSCQRTRFSLKGPGSLLDTFILSSIQLRKTGWLGGRLGSQWQVLPKLNLSWANQRIADLLLRVSLYIGTSRFKRAAVQPIIPMCGVLVRVVPVLGLLVVNSTNITTLS